MKKLKSFSIFILLVFTLITFGQSKEERAILGIEYAKQELKSALSDKSLHNVVDGKKLIIKDSLTAINIAEAILFDIYGKSKIIKQRPYETYLIDNHWVIKGTLPLEWKGGTFLIIIDARDSKIIRITHGK